MDTVSDEAGDRWLARVLARDATDAERAPGAALLLVEGPAGAGRSRLARRLLAGARASGVRTVAVAFSPFGAALAGSGGTGASPRPQGAPRAPERALPEGAPGARPASTPHDGGAPGAALPPTGGEHLTGEAFAAALDRLLAPRARAAGEGPGVRPVLLVAEDVHLADRAALRQLRRVLGEPPAGLATVLTYRPEELREPGLPLGHAARLPAGLAVQRLPLAPLDTAQVRAVVEEVLGPDCGPSELFARIAQRSAGNPQVAVDLARLLRDTGEHRERYTVRDLEAVGAPPRLAHLALARAAALPEAARPVVRAAAVLGEPVEAEELCAVAGVTGEAGTRALVGALRGGLLTEDTGGRYGFFAPPAASAVYAEIPGPVRRELHRTAAHVLGHRRPVPWMALARHRRHAGEVRGWLYAVEQAARERAAAGDHQAAVDLLEQTLSGPAVPLGARARLAPLLAHSAVLGLRSEQTVTVLRQILSEQSLPVAVRGEIRLDLGLLLCNQAVSGMQGRLELQQAVEELAERPVMAARAMSALAMPLLSTVPLERNLYWLERAEKTGAASGDEEARTSVAANRAGTLMYTGDPAAWAALEALPRDTDSPVYQQHVARGLCNAADGALWLGELGPARELLAEGVAMATRSGAAYVEEGARGTGLLLDWAEGRWDELPARARAFVAEVETMPGMAVDGRMVLGMLSLCRGEWQQATAWLTGDGPRDRDAVAVPHLAAASGALVRMALVREDVAAAAEEASDAWDRVRDKGVWVWAAELAPWAVEAALRAGRREAARGMVEEYAAGLAGRRAPASDAALLWCRALEAEADGEPAAAAALFREAAVVYAGLPRPYAAVLATESAARCALAGDGDTDAAVAELASCVERLTELGAGWDAARVRALLRAHRPAEDRRPRGRPGYGDELSPREQEVADLAATGLTNKEIAATLHLSPRTVEQHVARARRKLESRSGQTLSRGRSARGS
ncbi:LuxR C-terminal-related transcriptional regulator [Streptomyces sp. C10-9-1]|uniref:LuxR C-terminal-related transcriptional regulator n=1 Tax=Streptomyces sp. C10-9-1 TaxID=1859285 RepID=UPI003D750F2F